MIYCLNCGKAVPDESKFCIYCGTAIPSIDPQKTEVKTTVTESRQEPSVQTPPPKIDFYSNVGFWGAVILLGAFFLPFYTSVESGDLSLYQMVSSRDQNSAGMFLLLLFPISAIVLILQGLLNIFPPLMANIFKLLPLLLLIFCLGAFLREENTSASFSQFMKVAAIGVYATLAGAILVLFFRRKRG